MADEAAPKDIQTVDEPAKEDAKVDDEQNRAHSPEQDEPDKVDVSSATATGESSSLKRDGNNTPEEETNDPADDDGSKEPDSPSISERGDSSKSNQDDPLSDLKENEKKVLEEFRSRVEEAILTNKLFKKKQQQEEPEEKANAKAKAKEDEEERKSEEDAGKGKEKAVKEENHEHDAGHGESLCLWGVPLMPSRGDKGTDVVLLKFLRARDFKVNDALEMLSNTLQWRKETNIDSILDENLGSDYDSMASVIGEDRRGHPVCYNVYGVFGNENMYNKTFGTPESRDKFLRWRLQLMERQIQMLDFRRPELGKSSLLQINDLKDTPGPSRKDLRVATRQAVALLQDNYPEFVGRNIFINVPFWYYAFNALLSPFLTQRTKSKFVFARANRVTETLLKYIAGEQIPVKYGGLKREDDPDFSTEDGVSEITVKAGSTEVIEIAAPEVGSTLVWDLTVIGWEVNYKEEFVPSAESSYTVIVKKEKRLGWQEDSIRNSFRNNEPGKIILTIENGQFKRKRVLYRFKSKHV